MMACLCKHGYNPLELISQAWFPGYWYARIFEQEKIETCALVWQIEDVKCSLISRKLDLLVPRNDYVLSEVNEASKIPIAVGYHSSLQGLQAIIHRCFLS